jgi:protein involved in polysaccharide export with SLBB domain
MKSLIVAVTITASCALRSAASDVTTAGTNAPAWVFYVAGDGVVAPGRFVYQEGVTITKAIESAGGCTRWALKNRVELKRAGELQPRHVNVSQIAMGKTNDLKLQPGDSVRVSEARTVRVRR